MRFLDVFLLLYAVFITGLADGIAGGLSAIPGIGMLLGMAIAFCINVTLGAGLLALLALNDMYHPRLSPFGIVGGLLPGLDFLPFWVGLVAAGIIYRMNAEGKPLAQMAKTALSLQAHYKEGGSFAAMKDAARIVRLSRTTGSATEEDEGQENPRLEEEEGRTPLDLKSPTMNGDIARRHAPERETPKTYAQPA